ncbi:MAG: cbb3-type cytochrome c oxidase subunit 3 [Bdellovibrionales bacterium]|nr:cbb3-type cytochrome c oxidase subunit 3 [Bdellovibrionales bacterium]
MKSEALSQFTDIHYTITALFIFLVLFVGLTLWAYRKSGKALYEKMGEMPILEDLKDGRQ